MKVQERTLANKLARNVPALLCLRFAHQFMVIMPVAVPFFFSKGLSMQEIFSLQAIFAAVVLVSEVPSGYLADALGRRGVIRLGAALVALGHGLLLIVEGFPGLAVYELALGLGFSMLSGADMALLYDTELARGSSAERQRRVVSRIFSIGQVAAALSAALCSALIWVGDLSLVILVQALTGGAIVLASLPLTEAPRLTADGQPGNMPSVMQSVSILAALWHSSKLLRATFIAISCWPLLSYFAAWLIQQLWILEGIDLIYSGLLWGGLSLLVAIFGRLVPWLEDRLGPTALLAGIGLLPVVGYAGMALSDGLVTLIWAALFFAARGLISVLLGDALNRRVPGSHRATVNSMASCLFRVGVVLGGPWTGFAVDVWGMQAALIGLCVISIPVSAGLLLPLIRVLASAEASADPAGVGQRQLPRSAKEI